MKILKMAVTAFAVVMTMAGTALAGGSGWTLSSPSGELSLTVAAGERLTYAVTYRGRELVAPSRLGFAFADEPELGAGLEAVGEPEVRTGLVEAWRPVVRNRHAEVSLGYGEMTVKLREREGERRRLDLVCRAFDGGVAFRYVLYGSGKPGGRRIVRELTEYRVPETSFAWVGLQNGFKGPQEERFEKCPVKDIPATAWCLPPLLVEIDRANYVMLATAALGDWPGSYTAWRDGAVVTRLAPTPEEGETGAAVRFAGRTESPWRAVLVADNPGAFVETEVLRALNPPCAIADSSWIRPGMSAWDHWWSGEVKMEMPVIKEYIDLAAAQGWPYMLVDWQWYGAFNCPDADITKAAPQLDMRELVAYAKARNVRLWLWLYSSDVDRNDAYHEAFALYEKWGIAGVKIDFMDRYDQDMVAWYRKIVERAAECHLMVDFHGAFAPDGSDRTWPNLVTREGVKGAEYSKFGQDVTPDHNVTLAFTRMALGAMDYTPGGFLNESQAGHVCGSPTRMMNTRCQELAKFVVYESPYTVFCDHPTNVIGQAGADFLVRFPTEWDDTRVLGGYPGEWIAVARRSGQVWYVGVIGGREGRTVELKLPFACTGRIERWDDGKGPRDVVRANEAFDPARPLEVTLAPGGGFAAQITPER